MTFGVEEGLREGEQADDAGGVVACSGSGEAIGAIVAGELRIERGGGGKNCVEMRGENDDGAGAVGGKMGGGNESDDVADGVDVDVGETDFSEASG